MSIFALHTRRRRSAALLAALCFGLVAPLAAQTGSIVGSVTDALTETALEGARITIAGSEQRAVTSADGSFRLSNLPAGEYTITADYFGFEPESVTVTVANGQATPLAFVFNDGEVVELQTITIVAGSAFTRAVNQERAAVNLTSVVASDALGRLGAASVSEALRTAPGINLESTRIGQARYGSGRYVTVRGLNSDFNAVTVDGQAITTANFDGASRSVPLNVVSSNSADSISITKAITPEMDATGIGGAIDIRTPSAFNHKGTTAGIKASVRYFEIADEYTDSFPGADEFPFSLSAEATTYLNSAKTIGLAVGASYEVSPYHIESYDFGGYAASNAGGALAPTSLRFDENFDLVDLYGATLGLDFRPNGDFEVALRLNYSAEDAHRGSNRIQAGFDPGFLEPGAVVADGFVVAATADDRLRRFVRDYYELQSTTSGTLNFINRLDSWTVRYGAGFNKGEFEGGEDDTRAEFRSGFFLNDYDLRGDGFRPTYSNDLATVGASSYSFVRLDRGTRNIVDDDYSLNLSAEKELLFANRPTTLEFGVKYTSRSRDLDSPVLSYRRLQNGATWNLAEARANGRQVYGSVLADYTTDNTIDGGTFGYMIDPAKVRAAEAALRAAGVTDANDPLRYLDNRSYLSEGQTLIDSYDMTEDVPAAYAMATVEVGQLTILAGFRFEQTDVSFDGYEGDFFDADPTPVSTEYDYSNVLPHLHLRYDASDDVIVRASLNQSLARPTYRQLRPNADIDNVAQTITTGRTDLDPTLSTNFDFSVDWFYTKGGRLSAGLFYKSMEDNVYRFRSTVAASDPRFGADYAGYSLSDFRNAEGAEITGAELSAVLPFRVFTEALEGLSLGANLTYTDSSVDGIQGRANGSTELFGQVPLTYNVSLDFAKWGFSAYLAYNWADAQLDYEGINADSRLDLYVDESERLSAGLGYTVGQFSFNFVASNLTDHEERLYYGSPSRAAAADRRGTSYTFSVDWAL